MKTLSFTIMHFCIAITVAYVITGDWAVGGAIALIEPAVNSIGYLIHERLWRRREKKTGDHPNAGTFSTSPIATDQMKSELHRHLGLRGDFGTP